MPEFVLQFLRVIRKGQQDVLTPLPGHNDLSSHKLSVEDAPRWYKFWSLLAASEAMHLPNNADISSHISRLRNRFGGNLHKVMTPD